MIEFSVHTIWSIFQHNLENTIRVDLSVSVCSSIGTIVEGRF